VVATFLVGAVLVGLAVLVVAFPPRGARRFRRITRPLRRLLRPGHYRWR
jgi:hypothetical protein